MSLEGPAFARIPVWVQQKLTPLAVQKIQEVYDFVEQEVVPREQVMRQQVADDRWATPAVMQELRAQAKARGLWNLFLPKHFGAASAGLTNLEYACCAEIMGRCYWAAQTMNCHAPETGNIELLARFASAEQKAQWLAPLLAGTASSAYSMTEPDVASSDATQIRLSMRREGDEYVLNGRKLYGNCLWNKDLRFYIVMGCTAPEHPDRWRRHTMVVVPCDTPGITQVRNLTIMGYDWAPEGHGEFVYEDVRVPAANVILGEGRAFEIAQGRLGPGRIHHCMRLLGQCERAYELALLRCTDARKRPRGKLIGAFDSTVERVAQMRLELDAARLVVLAAADTMDARGNKAGKRAIAQSKVLVPRLATRILDECMQLYAGQGLTQHTPLPEMWTYARFVRVADGPDAAHRHQVGREELATAGEVRARHEASGERARALTEQYGYRYEEGM